MQISQASRVAGDQGPLPHAIWGREGGFPLLHPEEGLDQSQNYTENLVLWTESVGYWSGARIPSKHWRQGETSSGRHLRTSPGQLPNWTHPYHVLGMWLGSMPHSQARLGKRGRVCCPGGWFRANLQGLRKVCEGSQPALTTAPLCPASSTGDEHAPGNWGFLDVVAALHWVQGNISPFGGDFNSVTIFGNSAGASIVSALVSHPRGLATVSPTVPDLPALLPSSDSHLSSTLLPGPVPAGHRAIPQSHSTERSHHHSRVTGF